MRILNPAKNEEVLYKGTIVAFEDRIVEVEAEVAKISQADAENTGTSRAMPEHLQFLCDECSQDLDEG